MQKIFSSWLDNILLKSAFKIQNPQEEEKLLFVQTIESFKISIFNGLYGFGFQGQPRN